jgi:hypothetical protein
MDCFQIEAATYTVKGQIGFLGISRVEVATAPPSQMALSGGSVMDL